MKHDWQLIQDQRRYQCTRCKGIILSWSHLKHQLLPGESTPVVDLIVYYPHRNYRFGQYGPEEDPEAVLERIDQLLDCHTALVSLVLES